MTGRRLPDGNGPDGRSRPLAEGDYWKDANGLWWARPPGSHVGTIPDHTVVEHEDGTITVSPSLVITHWDRTWHGFLEKGQWRTA